MNSKKFKITALAIALFMAGAASSFFLGKSSVPFRAVGRRLPFEREVGLDENQRDKIKEIWRRNFSESLHMHRENREKLEKELESGIMELIPEGKREEYDRLHDTFREKNEQLRQERDRRFDEAVAETKKLLKPEQQEKYEEFLRKARSRFRGKPKMHGDNLREPPPDGGPFGEKHPERNGGRD